jgi:peptidoglycan/LPS O-acetylase OafA/YrhL
MHLVPEKSPLGRLLVFPFGLMALLGLALVWFQPDLVLRLAHCPLRDLTGVPCPTCGGTGAAVALTEGRWAEALAANPLVTLGGVVFSIWLLAGLVATVVPSLRRELVLTDREKKTARILAVVLLVTGWLYQLRAG